MCNYTMDPDGDVILTLEYPNDPFAPECGAVSTPAQNPDLTASAKSYSTPKAFSVQDIAEPEGGNKTEPVTFRVSSRHLALASPVFRSAFTGGWKESTKTEGELQINSEGWDTTALSIFLNTIHCKYRQVPRYLELEMLAKVAVIVDYYAAHEAMEILSPIWISNLRASLPTTTCHNRTIALWICISWVFGDSRAFETATRTAIHHGCSNMTDFGLPIPERVIEHINRDRKLQVNSVFDGLSGLREDLLLGRKGCGVECRTMQVGAVTMLLNRTDLLNHSSEKDYQALSVGELLNEVEAAVCPIWYGYHRKKQLTHEPHGCPGNAFDTATGSIAAELNSKWWGLNIRDYARSATWSKYWGGQGCFLEET
ncbi:hypothetical protein MFIFM68171_09833 [Madurella fahalii]|uniref:BTB domain-containing protein n=1 Tax=Madurella fahalii TaxID=1157608 RepID=A0ABQ0GPH4_9PEZI